MPSDRNDPNSIKQWYWHCSLCDHREPLLNNQLRRQYVNTEQKSFVKSFDNKKKPTISKEDIDDIKSIGTPTSIVSERDIPPPGY